MSKSERFPLFLVPLAGGTRLVRYAVQITDMYVVKQRAINVQS